MSGTVEAAPVEAPLAAPVSTPTPNPTTLLGTEAPVEPVVPAETPAEFVPLTAEALKFPEGFTIADGPRDEFLALMNDQKMSPADRAQALVNLQAKLSQEASETGSREWASMQEAWVTEAKADPDFGGAKLPATLTSIGKVIQQYGSPELREALNLTGAGNNPHVIRFLAKVAHELSEGKPVLGTPSASPPSIADAIFGTPGVKK